MEFAVAVIMALVAVIYFSKSCYPDSNQKAPDRIIAMLYTLISILKIATLYA